jgi:hypothetical protein
MAWRGSARAAIAAAKPGKSPALRRRTPPQQHSTETTAQALRAAPAPGRSRRRTHRRRGRELVGASQSPEAIRQEIQIDGDPPGEDERGKTARTDR